MFFRRKPKATVDEEIMSDCQAGNYLGCPGSELLKKQLRDQRGLQVWRMGERYFLLPAKPEVAALVAAIRHGDNGASLALADLLEELGIPVDAAFVGRLKHRPETLVGPPPEEKGGGQPGPLSEGDAPGSQD